MRTPNFTGRQSKLIPCPTGPQLNPGSIYACHVSYVRVCCAGAVFAMDFLAERFADVLSGKEVHKAGHCYFQAAPRNDAPAGAEDAYRKIIRDGYAAGKTIVVMDFGDPGIFSPQRGYLNEFADLKPVIVPGVSSFNAANAALGCDVISADKHALVITEAAAGRPGWEERLANAAKTGATLVLFTMKMDFNAAVAVLLKYYPPETPVSFVRDAGYAETQDIIRTRLDKAVKDTEGKLNWAYLMYVGCA